MSNRYPPSDPTYRLLAGPTDITSGGAAPAASFFAVRLTEQARALLPKIRDRGVADTTRQLIEVIEDVVSALAASGADVTNLPPVRASVSEAGSVLLEWTTTVFRLGFNIELDPQESGWYLATSKQLGFAGHGFLSQMTKQTLVSLVLEFVRANS